MKIINNCEGDALYIRFRESTVTARYAEEGIPFATTRLSASPSIEILDAVRRLADLDTLRRVVFGDRASPQRDRPSNLSRAVIPGIL